MAKYYDKDGQEIDAFQYADLFETKGYKRVAETTLPDGKWISTVWLGINHQRDDGPPLIFETMVFVLDQGGEDIDCCRYATLAEAQDGHKAMVKKWTDK